MRDAALTIRASASLIAPPTPRMSHGDDRHDRVALGAGRVERDGRPWIPVSGELHPTRVPRRHWRERLQLMRSGGVSVVSSYVLWIHHQPTPGPARFDGDRDIAAFVALAAEVGLDVVLRIGPWAHGEVRNGGLPDWVQAADVRHRTDDPGYLVLARDWFAELGSHLAGVCGPASPVIAVQLENELIDQPGHLVTLAAMAREAGITAPLRTATAWDGARLPAEAVLPLWGGYADGFWMDVDEGWSEGFRSRFAFGRDCDDPGIGADLRPVAGVAGPAAAVALAPPRGESGFPLATCELGGGMATAYHRRPRVSGQDTAALALVALGSGSNWQGYYMYAGGSNPGDALQESLATGYPNDLPRFDYDFQAPIGAAGALGEAHAPLRRQHAMLAALGERLAGWETALPSPAADDPAALRWAVRSDGSEGILLIAQHRPIEPLAAVPSVRVAVELDDRTLVVPDERVAPVDVPAGTIAAWPLGLRLGSVRVEWATASVLTVLDEASGSPVLVLLAEPGIAPVVAVRDAPLWHPAPDAPSVLALPSGERILCLPAADADALWVLEPPAGRLVLRSPHPLRLDGARLLVTVPLGARPDVARLDAASGAWVALPLDPGSAASVGSGTDAALAVITVDQVRRPGEPSPRYGGTAARTAAPSPSDVDRIASTFRLTPEVGSMPPAGTRRLLRIDWRGDVAVLERDGVALADRFWDGAPWMLDLDDLGAGPLDLRIVPLHPAAPIALAPEAAATRAAAVGPLHALDAVTVGVVRDHVVAL